MAAHDFGILPLPPEPGQRYVTYQPERYGCIRVDDDLVEGILEQLSDLPCYWISLSQPGRGLDYTGITLIPPQSLEAFLAVTGDAPHFAGLSALLRRALWENKWVIHYGI